MGVSPQGAVSSKPSGKDFRQNKGSVSTATGGDSLKEKARKPHPTPRLELFREKLKKIEAEKDAVRKAEVEAAAKRVREKAAVKKAREEAAAKARKEAAARRAREELIAKKRAKAEEKRRAAEEKKRLKEEEDKRLKAEAKTKAKLEAEERKAKVAVEKKAKVAQKAKALAEKQAKAATEKQAMPVKAKVSAKKIPKVVAEKKVRFLRAPPPPPSPSREDVGFSVVSIPAEAPKVFGAGLGNTPGVESLLNMIRGNGSGPGIGRKPPTIRPMTAPAIPAPASLDKGKASAATPTGRSVCAVDAKKRKVSRDSNDVVMWSTSSTSRAPSPFHRGKRAASGASSKAVSSQQGKRSTISLPGRGAAVEPPEVDSPEPGEVLPGDLVRRKGKGKRKAGESGVETAKGSPAGGRPRLTLLSQNMPANRPSGSLTARWSLGSAAKTATASASLPSGEKISCCAAVSLPAVKSIAGSKSSSKSSRKPLASSSSGGDICSIGGKATVKWAPRVSNKAAASTSTKAWKSKNRSRSPAKAGVSAAAACTYTPVPAPAAKSTPSERGLGRGKGKRGPAERETPAVKDGPFAPNGWGPKMTQEGTEWPKGALTVLNRLKRRDTLVNRDFLIKFPELNVGLIKEFSLPATEMAEYRALVGEPMVLSTLESRLREGYYKCPQHFVNEVRRDWLWGPVGISISNQNRKPHISQ